ncbi:MAG: CoA pyrophosphatase [Burkholderiaceae bacterium]
MSGAGQLPPSGRFGPDPRRLPYESAADGLRPLAAERLAVDAVRSRFREPPLDWAPAQLGDRLPRPAEELLPASVLVPIVDRDPQPSVLLTRRPAHMRRHSGQVAFPGGRREPGDRDPVATALREAAEEVGLDTSHVEVIGRLPDYTTGTGYRVTPVVAVVDARLVLRIDPDEVEEAFEVPLSYLMDPRNHRRHRFADQGVERQFLSMPYGPDGPDADSAHFIWGATAAMLRNLYHFLSAD